jgi:putative ABC transport system ATP-binding protein
MTSVVAAIHDVSKSYTLGTTTVQALRAVSLTIRRGECVAVAGPSGSGKSTLLHLIGCLDRPDAGSINLADTDVGRLSPQALAHLRRDHLGFIFQTFNLVPVLSAFENVEYPLLLKGVDAAERKQRVSELLGRVGLAAKASRRPDELSGGERQRVAIARALVNRPQLVLADEPTANLDAANSQGVLDLVDDLRATDGATFLFATHDSRVLQHMDRIIMMRDGTIAEATVSAQA